MTGSSQISDLFSTHFLSSHMYPENPEGTQVIVGSMNMGYISDTARNRISREEISHPSIGVKSYECFTFLTSNDVPLHQFIGTVCHCKLNIQDYYESLGNHEKPGLEETWSCLSGDQSHYIPFQPGSTIETKTWWKMSVSDSLHVDNLLQNRDPQSWCCKQ